MPTLLGGRVGQLVFTVLLAVGFSTDHCAESNILNLTTKSLLQTQTNMTARIGGRRRRKADCPADNAVTYYVIHYTSEDKCLCAGTAAYDADSLQPRVQACTCDVDSAEQHWTFASSSSNECNLIPYGRAAKVAHDEWYCNFYLTPDDRELVVRRRRVSYQQTERKAIQVFKNGGRRRRWTYNLKVKSEYQGATYRSWSYLEGSRLRCCNRGSTSTCPGSPVEFLKDGDFNCPANNNGGTLFEKCYG
eukprot:TRINITY_DN42885_c0_g1_i1.p1 TRINITY_DN42885_c0_g1~~TRINITY_DN42885_c0_g1_i1.p1  ORF type:complete len:247 (+),score=26.77 TRINITY_DN42885_c0_g1_i1:66-806(+)